MKKNIFAMLLVWMLAACGGGGGDEPTQEALVPKQSSTVPQRSGDVAAGQLTPGQEAAIIDGLGRASQKAKF